MNVSDYKEFNINKHHKLILQTFAEELAGFPDDVVWSLKTRYLRNYNQREYRLTFIGEFSENGPLTKAILIDLNDLGNMKNRSEAIKYMAQSFIHECKYEIELSQEKPTFL